MKKKTLFIALSQKLSDGEILVLDAVAFPDGKTKYAASVLKHLSHIHGFEGLAKKGVKIIMSPSDKKSILALRNISGVKTMEAKNLNALDILSNRYLILGSKDIKGLS